MAQSKNDRAASTTATGVAWTNVVHQLLDSPPRILDDPVIAHLMEATSETFSGLEPQLQTPRARALRSHVVTRARFAEDRLALAVAVGVRQYVVLGAGMDTFAYRQPDWARAIRLFEVDQPATQGVKRDRLDRARIVAPANVAYIAIDFEAESLADGLRRGGVRLDEPAFFSWLGVTMYLTRPAIDAVLRTVATVSTGSEIVFTFAQPPSAEEVREGPTLADVAAALGEPWITYFELEALERALRAFGFSRIEFLTPDETRARYFQHRADDLPSPRRTSIVSASR